MEMVATAADRTALYSHSSPGQDVSPQAADRHLIGVCRSARRHREEHASASASVIAGAPWFETTPATAMKAPCFRARGYDEVLPGFGSAAGGRSTQFLRPVNDPPGHVPGGSVQQQIAGNAVPLVVVNGASSRLKSQVRLILSRWIDQIENVSKPLVCA
jgi:hypothetical protein